MTTTAATFPANLRNKSGNWITGTVGPFEVQALVFTEGSDEYGMSEDRRISKLWVALPGTPRTVLYDYDRGSIGRNHLTADGLAEIVAAVTA